ncbi:hypothetical protein [Mycolicibacterium lacusdiani]|uniref:hypothetical protein n=1 Tax=Mycolicibacterium lacusdiani TaxID=2895283 RepID=UPI001F480703|nr:hypothetical protein [Mycolicibacterium lacusdiani]
MVAIAVLLVIGVTIGATLLFTRDGDGPSTPPTSDVPSDIASANDTGPVEIITEEPTCEAFIRINDALAEVHSKGWSETRSSLGPSSEWTDAEREQLESVSTAMRNAADQALPLVSQTPHRVTRELYEQFIAYSRAYVAAIPKYEPRDNALASTSVGTMATLLAICTAIDNGAAGRSLGVSPIDPPQSAPALPDSPASAIFMPQRLPSCAGLTQLSEQYNDATREWQAVDTDLAASQWSPQQREAHRSALDAMTKWADSLLALGRESDSSVFEDFTAAATVYLRAFISAGDSYTSADSWLTFAAYQFNQTMIGACDAAPE